MEDDKMSSMWHKDRVTEQLMTELKMKWDYRTDIPIQDIQVKESRKHNVRFGEALDEKYVVMYAYYMGIGRSFPAIVILPDNTVLAGNHRMESAVRAGRKTVDAYVVDHPSEEKVLEFIRRNNQHGKPLTEDQVLETCVQLWKQGGRTLTQLNDLFYGGGEKTYHMLDDAKNADDVKDRLSKLSVETRRLSVSHCKELNKVKDNAPVLREAASAAVELGMPAATLGKLISEIGDLPTEKDKIEHIKKIRVERIEASRTSAKTPHSVLKSGLRKFAEFLRKGNDGGPFFAADMAKDPVQYKEMKRLIIEVTGLLREIPTAQAPKHAAPKAGRRK